MTLSKASDSTERTHRRAERTVTQGRGRQACVRLRRYPHTRASCTCGLTTATRHGSLRPPAPNHFESVESIDTCLRTAKPGRPAYKLTHAQQSPSWTRLCNEMVRMSSQFSCSETGTFESPVQLLGDSNASCDTEWHEYSLPRCLLVAGEPCTETRELHVYPVCGAGCWASRVPV